MGNNTLTKKFMLFLFFTSIIPLIFVGVMSYNISKSIIQQQVQNDTIQFMQGQNDFMERLMGEMESLIANISNTQEIKNAIMNTNSKDDDYTKLTTQQNIGTILNGYTHLDGLVSIDIFTLDNNYYHVGDTLNTQAINTTVREKIFQKASEFPNQVVWIGIEDNVNENSQNKKVITAAKIIKSIDSQTLQETTAGLLLVNYSVDTFYDYFNKSDLGKGSYMMILDGENRLVFSKDKNQLSQVIEASFVNKLSDSKGSFIQAINGTPMLVTYIRSQLSNWLSVSIIPVSTLVEGTAKIKNYTIIALGVCFIVVLLMAGRVSRRIVTPINRITSLFKEIQEGTIDLNFRLEENANDEIGELTKWFNTFLKSLIAKRNMEQELQNAHNDLEQRVIYRTKELAVSNQSLREEIVGRIKIEKEINYLSLHDPLTGVSNRASFEQELVRLKNQGSNNISIIMGDVDGLKLVNDSLGHSTGDLLLTNAARIIRESIRENDFVARIGGDEFIVILYSKEMVVVETVCARIRNSVEIYNQENAQLPLSISIGYAILNEASNIDEVLNEADNNMYREKLYRSKSVRSALVNTMMIALEARDFITEGHVTRVQDMVWRMGTTLGFSERQLTDLKLFSQFHDIGKVGIPDSILFKPSALLPEETLIMRRHSEIGYRIAQSALDLLPIADWVLSHHEWWDGSGYPLGLKGEEIPLECRILTIADAYDAMTSDRPYRHAMTQKEAVEELYKCTGTQFDPRLVPVFVEILSTEASE